MSRVRDALFALARRREPDQNIGPGYLHRWHLLPRNPLFNIYLHRFLRSDDARALHDHPWMSLSYCLSGVLLEHLPGERNRYVRQGTWAWRWPRSAHRLDLTTPEAWTLFVTGPRVREWGFYCPQGWRHWRDFCPPDDPNSIGRGCD